MATITIATVVFVLTLIGLLVWALYCVIEASTHRRSAQLEKQRLLDDYKRERDLNTKKIEAMLGTRAPRVDLSSRMPIIGPGTTNPGQSFNKRKSASDDGGIFEAAVDVASSIADSVSSGWGDSGGSSGCGSSFDSGCSGD